MPISLKIKKCYPASPGTTHWRGIAFEDQSEASDFIKGAAKERATDAAFEDALASDLAALATTEMASQTLTAILNTPEPPLDWEIGEAIAECLLSDEFGAIWPWNENRDRKTPRASLPGADLVGFIGEGQDARFLFGEVKTSSDQNSPPNVMAGRSGLAHQIDTLAESQQIQGALLRWLYARCNSGEHAARFKVACERYLKSGGSDLTLVGVLLRDTKPNELDLKSRGEKLQARSKQLPKARLDAWYFPVPIASWPALVGQGGAP